MEVRHARCAGLDVHKRSVAACALVGAPGAEPGREVRTFGTMPADLEALADWLAARGCTHVALEATGAYWKLMSNVLEARGGFELVVANAEHFRAVPGRETDVVVITHQRLARGTTFEDLGGRYFDARDREATRRRAVRRLEALGYDVELVPRTTAS